MSDRDQRAKAPDPDEQADLERKRLEQLAKRLPRTEKPTDDAKPVVRLG